MADLAITKTQVVPQSNAVLEKGLGGEAITPGEPVYKDTSDGKWKLAINAAEATAAARGIAVSECGADGQGLVVQTGGDLDLGAAAGAAQGVEYYVSVNAGGLAPRADVLAADFVTVVCIGKGSNQVTVRPWRTGIAAV